MRQLCAPAGRGGAVMWLVMLGGVTLSLLAAAPCQTDHISADHDLRLRRPVDLALMRTSLDEVLQACTAVSGVACGTKGSAADLRVTVYVKQQPLGDVLRAIGEVLNLDLVQPGAGPDQKYLLVETEACRTRLRAAIREKQAKRRQAYLALISGANGQPIDGPPWLQRAAQERLRFGAIASAAQLMGGLPPPALDSILDGRGVSVPVAQLPPVAQRAAAWFINSHRAVVREHQEARSPDQAAVAPKPLPDLGQSTLKVVYERGGISISVVGPGGDGGAISLPTPLLPMQTRLASPGTSTAARSTPPARGKQSSGRPA